MSLAWHIAFKDLRRLRAAVAVWMTLIAAKLGLGAVLIWGAEATNPRMPSFDPIANASMVLAVLEGLMGYFLVVAVIHGDSLVGTTAFWMTRPISGGRLLAGKAVALAIVFGVIPLALTLPWWLACSYGIHEIALAAAETLAWHGVVMLIALPLAALTDGLSRFLLLTLVGIAGLVGASIPRTVAPTSLHEVLPPVLWALVLYLVGCAITTAVHFCQRRFFPSVTILALSAAGAAMVVIWPWEIAAPSEPAMDRPGQHAGAIELSFLRASVFDSTRTDARLLMGVRVEGLPPEFVLQGSTEHRWNWPDGLTLSRKGNWSGMNNDAGRLALGLAPEQERVPTNSRWGQFLRSKNATFAEATVPPAFPARVLRDPPAYRLRAHLHLLRPVVVGERPVQADETIVSNAGVTRIVGTKFAYSYSPSRGTRINSSIPPVDPKTKRPIDATQHLYVTLAEHIPAVFDPGELFRSGGRAVFGGWSHHEYLLVNRTRGNTSESDGLGLGAGRGWSTRLARIGTVGIVWRTLDFTPPKEFRAADNKWVDQPNWFENVTLAKLKLREEERSTKELRVERFELGPLRPLGGSR